MFPENYDKAVSDTGRMSEMSLLPSFIPIVKKKRIVKKSPHKTHLIRGIPGANCMSYLGQRSKEEAVKYVKEQVAIKNGFARD